MVWNLNSKEFEKDVAITQLRYLLTWNYQMIYKFILTF